MKPIRVTLITVTLVVTVVLGLLGLAWMGGGWGGSSDPRVAGRRLSSWFRVISRNPYVLGMTSPRGDPELLLAIDAFRSTGTNAVRGLVGELVRANQDSIVDDTVVALNEKLPASMQIPRLAPQDRMETAFQLLAVLDLGLEDLRPVLEPHLASPDPNVVWVAIQALGCVRRDPDRAALALQPFAAAKNLAHSRAAIRGLARLGRPATNAISEVLKAKAAGARSPEINALLSACGPAAEPALPMLTREWEAATDKFSRVELAVILCRIRPEHPEARAFLESVARGDERAMPLRIQPMEFARAIRRQKVTDAQFAPLLSAMLARESDAWKQSMWETLDALNQVDRGAVDRILRERADRAGSTNEFLRVHTLITLLRLQPTNEFARAAVVEVVRANRTMPKVESGIVSAAHALMATSVELPEDVQAMLKEVAESPDQHPAMRRSLGREWNIMRLRASLKKEAAERRARAP